MGMTFASRSDYDKEFALVDVGDTFKAPDGRYYIKISKVYKAPTFTTSAAEGPFNCVCLDNGDLKCCAPEQPVCLVTIEADVIER